MTNRKPADVPWWRYATKALLALGVAVVAAAGVITAAVADDHVTTSEWWAIAAAILGALIAPAAVYAVPNRPSGTELAVARIRAANARPTTYGGPSSAVTYEDPEDYQR